MKYLNYLYILIGNTNYFTVMTFDPKYVELKNKLTERQFETLTFYLNGYSYNQIAESMILTEGGARKHINNICKRLKIKRKEELHIEYPKFIHFIQSENSSTLGINKKKVSQQQSIGQKNTFNSLIKNNISYGDPELEEIVKDIYTTITERGQDISLNFFEIGLKHKIESKCKNAHNVRIRQSKAFFRSFNDLLKRKEENSLIKEEESLYNKIQDIIFIKLLNSNGITKIIGDYSVSLLRLKFNESQPTFNINGYERNIYNYISYTLSTVANKVSDSMISKKVIDAFFETKEETVIIVTDEDFKIRSINKNGENLFKTTIFDLNDKLLFTIIPELDSTDFDYNNNSEFNKKSIELFISRLGFKQVELSFKKIEDIDGFGCTKEITEFLFILDFKKTNISCIHNKHELLDNVIEGIKELRKENSNPKAIENSTYLLQSLYEEKESQKRRSNVNPYQILYLNDLIDFSTIKVRVLQDVKYLPEFNRVKVNFQNNKTIPFFFNSEILFVIIKNLVSNAISFQDKLKIQPTVNVSFNDTINGTEIKVEDNGEGIDENKLALVFNKGFKAHPSIIDGLGFGLYIVKKNVNSVNGIITIDSTIKIGTIVKINFPF